MRIDATIAALRPFKLPPLEAVLSLSPMLQKVGLDV